MELTVGTQLAPGPDTSARARIGATATSPAGLLTILETHLGLTAPRPTQADRITALIPRLHATAGFYSRSLQADEWGTARRLLHDQAALALEGWSGQKCSGRYDALWQLTREVSPCEGERWHAIALALADTPRLPLTRITLVDPLDTLPGAIRRVLGQLEVLGVALTPWSPATLERKGDLAGAQAPSFTPAGDTSLQLIRAPGPLEGADDLAAWLRPHLHEDTSEAPASIAILGVDATLDEALRRHALPGASAPRAIDALALLPLALSFVAAVPDPSAALEFLLLRPHPLPAALRHRLAAALRRTPAVGSPLWVEALERWRTDPNPSPEQLARADALLTPGTASPDSPWPRAELTARATTVATWARARAHTSDDAAASTVAAQCQRFLSLLTQTDDDTVAQAWALRMVAAATEDVGQPRATAQAGLQFVARPGGLITPVDTVVWWNFTRESAGLPRPLDLTAAERETLAQQGVHVRSAAARAQALAAQWWRPLSMARARVLLIAPRTNSPGEVLHPHPLWSELVAKIPRERRDSLVPTLEARVPGPGPQPDTQPDTKQHTEPLPKPQPTAQWRVPAGAITPRPQESPSSLTTLVGCPLQYTLKYPARLGEAAGFALDLAARDLGSLAHDVLAHVLDQRLRDPDLVETLARDTFERLGPTIAAALFQPGQATARDQARAQLIASARALTTWLLAHDLQIVGIEHDVRCQLEGHAIGGRIDLLASDGTTEVIIDHKLGGRTKRRDELASGLAVQLAAYAFVVRASSEPEPEPETEPGPTPAIGYFILRDQALLGIAGGPFSASEAVQGPDPAEVWEAFAAAARSRWDELRAGTVRATGLGHGGRPPRSRFSHGTLVQAPPCTYCDYDLMCGRLLEDEA